MELSHGNTEIIFGSEKQPNCTIVWPDSAADAQLADNWIRFALDYFSLLLILGVWTYLILKKPPFMKWVHF